MDVWDQCVKKWDCEYPFLFFIFLNILCATFVQNLNRFVLNNHKSNIFFSIGHVICSTVLLNWNILSVIYRSMWTDNHRDLFFVVLKKIIWQLLHQKYIFVYTLALLFCFFLFAQESISERNIFTRTENSIKCFLNMN